MKLKYSALQYSTEGVRSTGRQNYEEDNVDVDRSLCHMNL